ncbi:MAG: S9 family peptidase [Bacteroidota bacterium]
MMKKISFLFMTFFLVFQGQAFSQEKITLEDLYIKYRFHPSSVYGIRSMADGENYTLLADRIAIEKYSYLTGEKTADILTQERLHEAGINSISGYEFNSDESMILLITKKESIYRRSFTAEYYIYEISSGNISALSKNGPQQLATFSPDGSMVAFARNNNLFIKYLDTGDEKQITFDGEKNKIINGVPDWVYEEEFEYNQAFAWSPDNQSIAFCKFDESHVKNYHLPIYKGLRPELEENQLYPKIREWKYPKAGEKNSTVSVHVYQVKSGETIKMDVGEEHDQYIPRIKWMQHPDNLCIYRLNRLQNKLDLLMADRGSGESKVFFAEINKYFIDETLFDHLTFLEDGKNFIWVSEMDGYRHIYLFSINGRTSRQITDGNWDITDFYGIDEAKEVVYFQSAEESPLRRSVYSVSITGEDKKKLSDQKGTNSAVFSKNYSYYINYFSNVETPTRVSLHQFNGKEIRLLEDNTALKKELRQFDINYKEFFTFTTSEGVELNGYMIKPPKFKKNKTYPVFMTQYSGPNSQMVRDRWDFDWEYLLAQQGYLIICVDGRGTGARGEEFRKMTYLQLGKHELADQVETAKYAAGLPYTDGSRIGIFGWSYGGFMTSLCLTKGAPHFRMGIAVAPVTNWRYYDTIYTERFMQTPSENEEGYDENSPINFAHLLQGKLLLVHGTADDNVHPQNTYEFAEALVQAGKQFDMHLYTNRNHGIHGGYTTYHLYTKMVNYIYQNL